MDTPIPTNTPEIGGSGGSGGMMMVKMGRKGVKRGGLWPTCDPEAQGRAGEVLEEGI